MLVLAASIIGTHVAIQESGFQELLGTTISVEMVNVKRKEYLTNSSFLEDLMLTSARDGGLTILSSSSHQFDNQDQSNKDSSHPASGVALVLLAESHISAHSYPGLSYVSLDFFTCGSAGDVSRVVEMIRTALDADVFVDMKLARGVPKESNSSLEIDLVQEQRVSDDIERLLHMSRETDLKEFTEVDSITSAKQRVKVFRNSITGDTCLVVAGVIQVCSSYQNVYGELYAHLPGSYFESIQNVLIIGGGDTLALNEFLKYESLKSVMIAGVDKNMAEIASEYLGVKTHFGPDADSRVEWIFGKILDILEHPTITETEFDIIVVDLSETDPFATDLGDEFFGTLLALLSPRGVFIKNEKYHVETATLFNQFLEVTVPVPNVKSLSFILGSNQAPLFLPNFEAFDKENIETSFIPSNPTARNKLFENIVSQYSRRNNDYEYEMVKSYEERFGRSPYDMAKSTEKCVADGPSMSCGVTETKPESCTDQHPFEETCLSHAKWRMKECSPAFYAHNDHVQINFFNSHTAPVHVSWIGASGERIRQTLNPLKPSETVPVHTFLGHKFIITTEDSKQILADLVVTVQHLSHNYIGYAEHVLAACRNQVILSTEMKL